MQNRPEDQKDIFADAKIQESTGAPANDADQPGNQAPAGVTPRQKLSAAYDAIFERGGSAKAVVGSLSDAEREAVEAYLMPFYDAGKQSKDTGRAVIQGFRTGKFSTDGDDAFSLIAFLQGADTEAKFSLINVFGAVKE